MVIPNNFGGGIQMKLAENSFDEKKTDGSKKVAKIILAIIIVLVVAIIGIVITMVYIDNATLKIYVDGNMNQKIKDYLIFEDNGNVYVSIRDIAPFLGYKSYSGDYTDTSEDKSKCYVQCEDEVANFTLNSNKIYKLTTGATSSIGENYEYFYTDKPVIARDGKLYTTIEGIEKAFNISFTYDTDKKRMYLYTMPYLIQSYTNRVMDYGYVEIQNDFTNHKTVLNNMLIVKKDKEKNQYGVIDVSTGEALIEPKYDAIEYLQDTGDFLVTSNKKMGILSKNGDMRVQLLYDSIQLLDSDAGLYLAKRENKYGIIDIKGTIIVHVEYDEIGVDTTKFAKNNIKNKYLLMDSLIPIRKDKYWGIFDKTGKQLLDFEYDTLGYTASSNKDALNLLVVPDYNMLVVGRDKKYALINSSGEVKVPLILDDAYMTINSGVKHYYMNFNDKRYDIEQYLDDVGVKPASSSSSNSGNGKNTNSTGGKDTNTTASENTSSSNGNSNKVDSGEDGTEE